MDTEVDDLFVVLSFLKLCKAYRRLKRKRQENNIVLSSQKLQNTGIKELKEVKEQQEDNSHETAGIIEINHEEFQTYANDPHEEQQQFDELIEATDRLSDGESQYLQDEHLVIEQKPLMIENETYVEQGQEYQYAISFEVNGEQRHVVLGGEEETEQTTAVETQNVDSTYESPAAISNNGAEIYYDVCPEGQEHEVLLETAEEFVEDACEDGIEICYEVNAEEIEEYPAENATEIQDATKKQRRRKRRGQNVVETEEDEASKEKRPRTRLFKVRPENLNRHQEGFFGRVFLEMKRHNEEQFLILTRMNKDIFEKLLKMTFKAMCKRAQHIYPEERLSITLLYLAHGTPFDVIAKQYKLGKTTVRNLVLETCDILYQNLSPIYLREPTSEEYVQIAQEFNASRQVPNCIGVVDGKHIVLKKPRRTVLEELNYTNMNSLVVMAACDANHIIRSATVTVEPHQSTFAKGIMNNTLPLPPNFPLPDDGSTDFPYYYIGSTSFPLRTNLMCPFDSSTTNTSNDKEVYFNYRLSLCQSIMENTFIMLSSMWKVLLTTFDLSPLNCESIVMASIVLYNFVMLNGGDRWNNADGTVNAELPHNVDENTEWINVDTVQYRSHLESISEYGGESSQAANDLRNILVEHFYREGHAEIQPEMLEV
ncbi:uncharacterized protein [Musca autumnalis]|uniref:uncharacterized protein n=1 Tax=Musca autumnalis TaxID=221902 RepID=UPI003CEA213E